MEISPRQIGTGTLGEGPASASAFEALRSCLVPQEQKIPLHGHPQPQFCSRKDTAEACSSPPARAAGSGCGTSGRSITIGAEFNIARVATPAVVGSNWKIVYLRKEIKGLFKLNAIYTASNEYIISIYEVCTWSHFLLAEILKVNCSFSAE